MSNRSFLDRFQHKIATTTAQGHFQHHDGSSQVRVGPRRQNVSTTSTNVHVPQKTSTPPRQNIPGTYSRNSSLQKVNPPPSVEKKTFSASTGRRPSLKKTAPSRGQELNEKKATKTGMTLAYSKKSRSIEYEPNTTPTGVLPYVELGKLQPDLNDVDLVAKRANSQRVKAFSRQLRCINQKLQSGNVSKNVEKKVIVISARDRARAFADKVPKPKTNVAVRPEQTAVASSSLRINNQKEKKKTTELEELQRKHRASKAQVEAIRRTVN